MENSIYDGVENPYGAWLETTTEKDLLEAWLRQHLPCMRMMHAGRPISILDMGCSWGNTSVRFMRILRDLGIDFRYTGVDPSRQQLEKFAQFAQEQGVPTPELVMSDVESYVHDEKHDLTLASHLLYYTKDMRRALQRIVDSAQEAVIVHHGVRGINTLQEAFREIIPLGPHLISTDEDVACHLEHVDLRDRQVKRYQFTSTTDISSCLDKNSLRGRNLLTFFFEREFHTISAEDVERVREFLQKMWGPSFLMEHDDSIFLVS